MLSFKQNFEADLESRELFPENEDGLADRDFRIINKLFGYSNIDLLAS